MSSASIRALSLSLGANLGIALAKFAVATFTGSASLFTEAVHSTADCGNQVLLYLGLRQAQAPPTPRHPLGRGQAAFVASFLVALLLFTVGGLYSVIEGLHKIHHPELPHHLGWAVGLLVFAFALEGVSMLGALKAAKPERGRRSLIQYMRESSATELVVVLAEDAAALMGLGIALLAVVLVWATGNPLWDALGSLLIGLLLIAVAVFVGTEVSSLLLNEAPPLGQRARIRAFVLEDPEVEHVLGLVAVVIGSDRLMVSLQVQFRNQASGDALVDRINDLERRLRVAFPQIRHLFVEPDRKP